MKAPPGTRITIDYDSEGHMVARWEAVSAKSARIAAAVMLAVGACWAYVGRHYPGEFRVLLSTVNAPEPDWVRLVMFGAMALVAVLPPLALAAWALRLLLRPLPERVTFGSDTVVYEAGTALNGMGSGVLAGPTSLLRLILGNARAEANREDLRAADAVVVTSRGTLYVKMGTWSLAVGPMLGKDEKVWLADAIVTWAGGGRSEAPPS